MMEEWREARPVIQDAMDLLHGFAVLRRLIPYIIAITAFLLLAVNRDALFALLNLLGIHLGSTP